MRTEKKQEQIIEEKDVIVFGFVYWLSSVKLNFQNGAEKVKHIKDREITKCKARIIQRYDEKNQKVEYQDQKKCLRRRWRRVKVVKQFEKLIGMESKQLLEGLVII
ncbi:unnamed protein product [Paramecium sonneborni]|uniref:Uncharacterized protein n=1 Tax=Paramecium sonneborni TaxID=65129 RepID=A0A8S1NSP6_9CILI|nr:unnamed protein product [Paramecium sonneborni]